MPTGRPGRARLAAALALAALMLLPGCDVIKEPVVLVTLASSSDIITGTVPVQLLATVTEDGNAQANLEVLFTASRGTFSGGQSTMSETTDSVGLAVASLTLPDDGDTSPVEVTAAAVEANVMAMKTLSVQAGGGR